MFCNKFDQESREQSYQNVSRETFWYDWEKKRRKPSYLRRALREIARKFGLLRGKHAGSEKAPTGSLKKLGVELPIAILGVLTRPSLLLRQSKKQSQLRENCEPRTGLAHLLSLPSIHQSNQSISLLLLSCITLSNRVNQRSIRQCAMPPIGERQL
jgi:hypothetical protein